MQQTFSTVKVNNEIELCEVMNMAYRKEIERALLKNRISYYIRWPRTSIFSKKKDNCIICVNDNSKEEAEAVVRMVCEETGFQVKFIMKRSHNDYL